MTTRWLNTSGGEAPYYQDGDYIYRKATADFGSPEVGGKISRPVKRHFTSLITGPTPPTENQLTISFDPPPPGHLAARRNVWPAAS